MHHGEQKQLKTSSARDQNFIIPVKREQQQQDLHQCPESPLRNVYNEEEVQVSRPDTESKAIHYKAAPNQSAQSTGPL